MKLRSLTIITSDDNNFGITAKDNKAAEKKPAEKNSTEKKSAEKKSEEKKIAEKKSSTSSIRKQARLFLACLCFAGAVFAAVLTAGTLTGCKIDSILPSQTEAGKEQAASTPQTALQSGQADQAGGNLPEGDSGNAENTDEAVPGSGQGSAASSSEPLLTLPYDESDPAQKSSAHNWLCSDLVENSQKLGEYALTEDFHFHKLDPVRLCLLRLLCGEAAGGRCRAAEYPGEQCRLLRPLRGTLPETGEGLL